MNLRSFPKKTSIRKEDSFDKELNSIGFIPNKTIKVDGKEIPVIDQIYYNPIPNLSNFGNSNDSSEHNEEKEYSSISLPLSLTKSNSSIYENRKEEIRSKNNGISEFNMTIRGKRINYKKMELLKK